MAVRALEYDDIVTVAETIGHRPDSALGQFYLHDADAVRSIVSTCEVHRGDSILEIGSGMGAVHLALLDLGAWVHAVEIDPLLARQLAHTAAVHCHSEISRLCVSNRDVLNLPVAEVKPPTVAVVSLPPSVATAAVLHLLTEFASLRSIVAVVDAATQAWQAARPGTPGYDASVAKLRYLADIRPHGVVPAAAFWPIPRRGPDVVRLDRLDD